MKKGLFLVFLTMGFVVLFGSLTVYAGGETASDFALFDGTNTDNNTDPGALCGVSANNKTLKTGQAFTYYVAVTNDDNVNREIKVIYTDGDFVRYIIPPEGSFSFSQAAGGPGGFDAAIRVDADVNVSGSMSAFGHQVFCISCDCPDQVTINPPCENPLCELIIPN